MKYFTMKELTKSSTADKLGIDNTPTTEASVALSNLVTHGFRPLAGDVREGDNRQFGLSLSQTQCRCGWCEKQPAHEG